MRLKKKKIYAGVIGLGFGETHLKSLKSLKECKIVKICDFNKLKKKIF